MQAEAKRNLKLSPRVGIYGALNAMVLPNKLELGAPYSNQGEEHYSKLDIILSSCPETS